MSKFPNLGNTFSEFKGNIEQHFMTNSVVDNFCLHIHNFVLYTYDSYIYQW